MKNYLFSILVLILFLSFGFEESGGEQERMFYGKTALKIPASINTAEEVKFSVNFSYQKGPYFLKDLNAVIDVYPKSASRFVNVEIESSHPSLSPTHTTIFEGTITVDPKIPTDTIFLSLYYMAKDNHGAVYKSSWTDSSNPIMVKKIEKSNNVITSSQTDNHFSNTNDFVYFLKHKQYEYVIPYKITTGKIQSITLDCRTASVLIHLDKVKTGNLTINIPKKMLVDEEFIVLVDGEELPIQTQSDTELTTILASLENSKVVEVIAAHYVSQMPQYHPICGSGDLRSPYYRLLSPIHQSKSGIPVTQIQCNEGLMFLIKPNIKFGGCFVIESADRMYARGWSMPSGNMDVFQ